MSAPNIWTQREDKQGYWIFKFGKIASLTKWI